MTDRKFGVTLDEGHRPLADDEPVFVFRALDICMAPVLAYYAEQCRNSGASPEHIMDIERHRLAVLEWQHVYGAGVPD